MPIEISANIFLEYSTGELIEKMQGMSMIDRRAIYRQAVSQDKKDIAHAIANAFEIDGDCIFTDFNKQYQRERELRNRLYS